VSKSHYSERDIEALGHYFTDHLSAMTIENLHSKADIAAELAWRDARIAELEDLQRWRPVTERPCIGQYVLWEKPGSMTEYRVVQYSDDVIRFINANPQHYADWKWKPIGHLPGVES